MYGKTYKPHNSPALAPAEALLVSSSPAFDGLHDDIKFFILACFYRKLLKKRPPHGEREPTIVIQDSERSNYIELVTRQWRKSVPPILSISHCEFHGARFCAHARKTILLAPIHSFTKQIVPSMYEESLT